MSSLVIPDQQARAQSRSKGNGKAPCHRRPQEPAAPTHRLWLTLSRTRQHGGADIRAELEPVRLRNLLVIENRFCQFQMNALCRLECIRATRAGLQMSPASGRQFAAFN